MFRRLSRGVELTVSGVSFLEDTKAILAQLDRAVKAAESLARGHSGRLRVGFGGATYLPTAVPDAILHYRRLYSDVSLFPEQSNTPALIHALVNGTVDIAFIRPPFNTGPEIQTESFLEEEMLVVLPAHHPLAGTDAIHLHELADETFILFPREVGPGLHDSIIAACLKAGFSPRLGTAASQIVAAVPMVAAGFGVSVVPASVASLAVRGVAFFRIRNTLTRAPISLAWRRDDHSPTLRNFLTALRKFRRGMKER